MDQLKEVDRRIIVAKFYESHKELGKAYTVRHFREMGVSDSTVYNIIQRVENGQAMDRTPGFGRCRYKLTNGQVEKILTMAEEQIGSSQRVIARKFGISQRYVGKLIKKSGMKYKKREQRPSITEAQEERQKVRLNKLARGLMTPSKHLEIIEDDGTYLQLKDGTIQSNCGY